jgi:hypothetical protein
MGQALSEAEREEKQQSITRADYHAESRGAVLPKPQLLLTVPSLNTNPSPPRLQQNEYVWCPPDIINEVRPFPKLYSLLSCFLWSKH